MSENTELIYDRLIANEKLKAGSKYERLAAIAFRILTERTTIHDLRLRGEVGVPHQIDAVVGDNRSRILIEAKDYDRNVDLPVVRDFSAVVDDLKPDEAFVVTTSGFSDNAQKWAEKKGLRLAILRPPNDEQDWGDLLKRIDFTLKMSVPSDPQVEWFVDPSEAERFAGDLNPIGYRDVDDISVGDYDGPTSPFRDSLDPQLNSRQASLPAGEPGELKGKVDFDPPTWLHLPDEEPIKVTGYQWTQSVASATQDFSIGLGIGGLAAELVLRTLDGSIHRMYTNRQIESWSFDGKKVSRDGR